MAKTPILKGFYNISRRGEIDVEGLDKQRIKKSIMIRKRRYLAIFLMVEIEKKAMQTFA